MRADKAQVFLVWFWVVCFVEVFLLAFVSDSDGLLARYLDN